MKQSRKTTRNIPNYVVEDVEMEDAQRELQLDKEVAIVCNRSYEIAFGTLGDEGNGAGWKERYILYNEKYGPPNDILKQVFAACSRNEEQKALFKVKKILRGAPALSYFPDRDNIKPLEYVTLLPRIKEKTFFTIVLSLLSFGATLSDICTLRHVLYRFQSHLQQLSGCKKNSNIIVEKERTLGNAIILLSMASFGGLYYRRCYALDSVPQDLRFNIQFFDEIFSFAKIVFCHNLEHEKNKEFKIREIELYIKKIKTNPVQWLSKLRDINDRSIFDLLLSEDTNLRSYFLREESRQLMADFLLAHGQLHFLISDEQRLDEQRFNFFRAVGDLFSRPVLIEITLHNFINYFSDLKNCTKYHAKCSDILLYTLICKEGFISKEGFNFLIVLVQAGDMISRVFSSKKAQSTLYRLLKLEKVGDERVNWGAMLLICAIFVGAYRIKYHGCRRHSIYDLDTLFTRELNAFCNIITNQSKSPNFHSLMHWVSGYQTEDKKTIYDVMHEFFDADQKWCIIGEKALLQDCKKKFLKKLNIKLAKATPITITEMDCDIESAETILL